MRFQIKYIESLGKLIIDKAVGSLTTEGNVRWVRPDKN